ncbi:hypothetical protein [Ruminococcus albus]|uniref:Uncharacterized protein n=1 Tax=Ruminococcus albus (strain ATCC 27210 / DSM 20455 / JCM 14654 / NCDO 2250 / 7) TaxID=697329 RepID=E6UC52_RUMA7|nr:hypothetical protein [Ruminococcus albus]ADU22674.1 hypothetical protein Rumal_2188 [Ruminococcus albus 7 = DSM 20455]
MADNKHNKDNISSYGNYKLKKNAVDRLLDAKKAPEVSYSEIRKYTSDKKFSIPSWLKIIFIKFWFAGAVCYFILWGLGIYVHGLDLLAVLAIASGLANDLMVNKLLRGFEPREREYDRWMMVTVRKYWSLFINVLYSGIVIYCVFRTYFALNVLLGVDANADASAAQSMLGVEPLLFGLLYLGFDMLFITIKNTFIKIFQDAGAKASCTNTGGQG